MKVASLLNGVDVDHLMEIIEAVRSTPELAKFRFRARNRWIEGTYNRTSIRGFYGVGMEDTSRTKAFQVDNDGPPVLLGENQGANPAEFLLHALAGCMTTTFVAGAAARGLKIDSIETELEGDLDLRAFLGITDEVRRGYREIRVTFRVTSDAPREEIEELIELARQRSPVYDVLSNPTPIRVTLVD